VILHNRIHATSAVGPGLLLTLGAGLLALGLRVAGAVVALGYIWVLDKLLDPAVLGQLLILMAVIGLIAGLASAGWLQGLIRDGTECPAQCQQFLQTAQRWGRGLALVATVPVFFFIAGGLWAIDVMLHFVDRFNFDGCGLSGAGRFLASNGGDGRVALGAGCKFDCRALFAGEYQFILGPVHSGCWSFCDMDLALCKCPKKRCPGFGIWIVLAAIRQR
jgi:hypothetical protein